MYLECIFEFIFIQSLQNVWKLLYLINYKTLESTEGVNKHNIRNIGYAHFSHTPKLSNYPINRVLKIHDIIGMSCQSAWQSDTKS